jgi:hypothetical protein
MNSYVLLILLLWNHEGKPVALFEPMPVFATMEECEKVALTAEAPPKGYAVTIECHEVKSPGKLPVTPTTQDIAEWI